MRTLPAFHWFPPFPHRSHTLTAAALCLQNKEEKDLAEVCRRLMANMDDGNCTLVWQQRNGKIHFERVEINGNGEAFKKHIFKKIALRRGLIEAVFHSENQTGSRVL